MATALLENYLRTFQFQHQNSLEFVHTFILISRSSTCIHTFLNITRFLKFFFRHHYRLANFRAVAQFLGNIFQFVRLHPRSKFLELDLYRVVLIVFTILVWPEITTLSNASRGVIPFINQSCIINLTWNWKDESVFKNFCEKPHSRTKGLWHCSRILSRLINRWFSSMTLKPHISKNEQITNEQFETRGNADSFSQYQGHLKFLNEQKSRKFCSIFRFYCI